MTGLIRTANFDDCDAFYADLLAAHDGMDEAATHAFNARLVLVLANHVGDAKVLQEALSVAMARGKDSSDIPG